MGRHRPTVGAPMKRDNNDLLTQVGPATPMGALMRQYWLPVLLSSELPATDGDPVRVMHLGERLVAFRSSGGDVGLLPAQCPHRGAPLFYGRVEDFGLRCVYHGWKFDSSGRCVEMPNEPAGRDFCQRLPAFGYPCVERAGLVWAYLGPRKDPPPLPHLEALDAQPELRSIRPSLNECNWLQALEGDIDTVHLGFLHCGHGQLGDAPEGTFLDHVLRHPSL